MWIYSQKTGRISHDPLGTVPFFVNPLNLASIQNRYNNSTIPTGIYEILINPNTIKVRSRYTMEIQEHYLYPKNTQGPTSGIAIGDKIFEDLMKTDDRILKVVCGLSGMEKHQYYSLNSVFSFEKFNTKYYILRFGSTVLDIEDLVNLDKYSALMGGKIYAFLKANIEPEGRFMTGAKLNSLTVSSLSKSTKNRMDYSSAKMRDEQILKRLSSKWGGCKIVKMPNAMMLIHENLKKSEEEREAKTR